MFAGSAEQPVRCPFCGGTCFVAAPHVRGRTAAAAHRCGECRRTFLVVYKRRFGIRRAADVRML